MANRYWVGGGSSANFNATGNTNWSDTSGGANNFSVPTSADIVYFDGAGANGNTNATISATITVGQIIITSGYTSTMTHNAVLTIAGAVWTMHSGYTIAGSSAITLTTSTLTITSGGKSWPNNLNMRTSDKTITLVGDFVVGGALVYSTNIESIINKTTSETLSCNGISQSNNSDITGTITIILTGGTWSASASNAEISTVLVIAGNVTISGSVYFNGSLQYSSGTPVTTGSTLYMASGNPTLDTDGMTWNNVVLAPSAQTYTINSLFNVSGILSLNSGNHIFTGTHGFNVNILLHPSTLSTYTLVFKADVEYFIYGELRSKDVTLGNSVLFASSSLTTPAKITLVNNGSCLCNTNSSFRDIDASGGRSICTFGGTITDCINVVQYYDYKNTAL